MSEEVNPQAFPKAGYSTARHHIPGNPGMSLRDYFAGQVAPAIIAVTSAGQHQPIRHGETMTIHQAMARDAYEFADAMLAARQESAS